VYVTPARVRCIAWPGGAWAEAIAAYGRDAFTASTRVGRGGGAKQRAGGALQQASSSHSIFPWLHEAREGWGKPATDRTWCAIRTAWVRRGLPEPGCGRIVESPLCGGANDP